MTAKSGPGGGRDWSRVRVGAVLVLGIVLLAYGVYQVGALFDIFADRYVLFTPVSSTVGLREGAPVTLAGQRVGQVEAIEFIPIEQQTRENNLVIRMAIDRDVREHVRRNSWTRIHTQGLVGDKYVNIHPGSREWPSLEPGDTLPSEPSVDIDRVLVQAYDVLREAETALGDVRTVTTALRSGEGTLGQLLVNDTLYDRAIAVVDQASVLLAEMRAGEGTLGRLVADPTLYNRLVGALTRVDTLAAAITGGQGTLGRLLREDTLYVGLLSLLGEAQTTVARADSAVVGLGQIIAPLANGDGDGTLARVLTDPALYDEFLRAVIDLQTLIMDIRENPLRYRPELNIDVF